jgi:hypothetical protein
MLESPRVRASVGILDCLLGNPYLKATETSTVAALLRVCKGEAPSAPAAVPATDSGPEVVEAVANPAEAAPEAVTSGEEGEVPEEAVSAYLAEHATEIAGEQDKPFQPVGGIVELLGSDYFPVSENKEMAEGSGSTEKAAAESASAASAAAAKAKPAVTPKLGQRDNTMQKINRLDVKGRIQLAMKGNKEERSILIRDGTKVVALAVLDAPKISDGEVEKFALQKNVLEAVLRQIPLKRRFMKNYIVVRNLVSNPRTPLDLGLGLMKHLQVQDLKNVSANKEVSETVRKLALKMYKQKLDQASKK